jgi:flagellar motor switch protein FliG
LKHFDPSEVEEISLEVARTGKIDNAEAQALLAEFGVVGEKSKGFKAGSETAKSMLTAAFGESRAKRILTRVVPETREKPFGFLGEIDPDQILLLLKNESAPTISIILPYLPPQKASKVLQSLSPELQRQVIRRIAKMKKVDPDVIVRIEGVLKERIRTQGRVITEEIDGRRALADILKYLEYSQEEKILDDLASSDPELSQDVKDRLFTIELVFDIDDADLQAILRDYDDEEIAVILKAKDERIQQRILSNLSSRRQLMVREEILSLGKMRKSDVDSATKDFVDYLVELDDQRKITIHRNDKIVD